MDNQPDRTAVEAWVALTRAQRHAMAAVEQRLKEAGLPPLEWYDALLELERAGECGLRPFELERAMLFEQYNLSRLADRLVKAGLVTRCACPEDRRGQVLGITPAGRDMRRRMWQAYGPAIEEAVGARLGASEAGELARLLRKLTKEKGGA